MVTAKHVVMEANKFREDIWTFVNDKEGKLCGISMKEILYRMNSRWILHNNTEIDLAVTPFPIFHETSTKRIQDSLIGDITELSLMDDVFFFSYQPNMGIDRVDPIVRTGTVSFIKNDKSY